MAPILRVSRQRLTTCPGCKTHIQVADNWRNTTCPFCKAPLTASVAKAESDLFSNMLRSVAGVTGSLVAASLLGLGLISCDTTDTGLLADTVKVQDASAPPVDAGTIDTGAIDNTVIDSGQEEAPITPLYGLAPDPISPDAGTSDA